ncbi:unnamed protein product [Protopolystoma xenopodis]|uniref:Uncharacterized protein n=1 Tax=Protopolystoma xenopodis TaxID=117903 RepID=A0A3S5FGW0_9PLAT|nr:unnamed protein product [Protopolystoma xenopodis]
MKRTRGARSSLDHFRHTLSPPPPPTTTTKFKSHFEIKTYPYFFEPPFSQVWQTAIMPLMAGLYVHAMADWHHQSSSAIVFTTGSLPPNRHTRVYARKFCADMWPSAQMATYLGRDFWLSTPKPKCSWAPSLQSLNEAQRLVPTSAVVEASPTPNFIPSAPPTGTVPDWRRVQVSGGKGRKHKHRYRYRHKHRPRHIREEERRGPKRSGIPVRGARKHGHPLVPLCVNSPSFPESMDVSFDCDSLRWAHDKLLCELPAVAAIDDRPTWGCRTCPQPAKLAGERMGWVHTKMSLCFSLRFTQPQRPIAHTLSVHSTNSNAGVGRHSCHSRTHVL